MKQPLRQPYDDLVAAAIDYHNAQLAHARSEFRLSDHECFQFDQPSGLLTFSTAGIPQVYAPAQVIGTHSTASESWLWAWENTSILPNLVLLSLRIREFGERHAYDRLTTARFPASEREAWFLAAVALYISHSEVVYKCPSTNGSTFLAVQSLSWAT